MFSAAKTAAPSAGGYNLTRSLRFRSSASAYLNRTPASAGNQKTWTYSNWVKRGQLGATQNLFTVGTGSGLYFYLRFLSTDVLEIFTYDASGGTYVWQLQTTQVFRDPSAWYHILISTDTTQATSSNRVKLYINGTQVTAFAIASYPSLNYDTRYNANVASYVNSYIGSSAYFDGYTTEFNSIDGQALTPSSFGSTNALTGVWQPARYAGTYGTNGFYLPFTDNSALTTSSNVGLGKDFSGNGNYWTTNNISITSGVTYDSMTDVPTLTSATASNFAVLNPLKNYNNTIVDGNLNISSTSSSTTTIVLATIGMSSGKWYWEFVQTSYTVLNAPMIGIAKDNVSMTAYVGSDANGWGYYGANGEKYTNATGTAYGAIYTNNDVMGVAFDADAGTLTFYKNNVSQGTAFTGLTSGPYFPAFSDGGSIVVMTANVNFGQRPFAYTPPTGYVALNTFNLPTPTILAGNKYMDATLWTGADTGTGRSISGLAFAPDFWWNKPRSKAYSHMLYDTVRGAGSTKELSSNSTAAEGGTNAATYGYLSSFDSSGVTWTRGSAGSGADPDGYADYDELNATYVGWSWKAGQGTTSSNTSGSITSTVSVNATAGFSVVTYTGTGANATVGHGLGVAPVFIIVKCRNTAGENWQVYSSSLTSAAYRIRLNTADAQDSQPTMWNSTAPTSSVFSVGTATGTNASTQTYVAYCFASISGYSALGSYTGNGSNDGPMVYTGFRPKYVMIKRYDSTGGDWWINDSVRNPYNVAGLDLAADSSSAESNDAPTLDFLSNGFKLRNGSYPGFNASGSNYIYACFAENPFRYALAR